MSVFEKEIEEIDAVTLLMQKADEQGYLTSENILEAFPEAEENIDQLEEVFIFLQAAGIDIEEEPLESEGLELLENLREREEQGVYLSDLSGISSDDIVGLYLKEIARVPQLSMEEEVRLAKLLERGRTAARQYYRLERNGQNPAERDRLKKPMEEGKIARDHLIEANTWLVVSIAKKYMGQGVPFLDLIQEGNCGLMKAVEKFDYRRGYPLRRNARLYILKAITRAIAAQGYIIRVTTSLETLVDGKGEDELDELLGDITDDRPTPETTVTSLIFQERTQEILQNLPPPTERILRLRFGVENGRSYTLEEVGYKFGLTSSRIQQIAADALSRLRQLPQCHELRDFLNK